MKISVTTLVISILFSAQGAFASFDCKLQATTGTIAQYGFSLSNDGASAIVRDLTTMAMANNGMLNCLGNAQALNCQSSVPAVTRGQSYEINFRRFNNSFIGELVYETNFPPDKYFHLNYLNGKKTIASVECAWKK